MIAGRFNLKKAQKKSLTIAKELGYNETVMEKIMCAKTQGDLNRALKYGRQIKGGISYDCIGRI